MFDFKIPTLADKGWISEALKGSGRICSESCFGNLYMWYEAYDCTVANVNGTLVFKAAGSYTMPVGGDNPDNVLKTLIDDYRERGEDLKLHCICESQKKKIETDFPGVFEFHEERDSFDYVYSVEELANLAGKKYHGKRNHISYFENSFDWSYEDMTVDSAKECLEFSKYWMATNAEKLETGTDGEYIAIEKALLNYDELGLVGGILRVQGDIVAYTFGEPLSDNVFCTHVEKASSDIRGAYPMINREFARNTINSFELVNREEDLGIPGLRKAKESYHPTILLTKYTARFNTRSE